MKIYTKGGDKGRTGIHGGQKKNSENEIMVDISDIINFSEKNGTLKKYSNERLSAVVP